MVPLEKVESAGVPPENGGSSSHTQVSTPRKGRHQQQHHDISIISSNNTTSSSIKYKGYEWMEAEPGDPKLAPSKQECSKLVNRINKDLSIYCCLSMGLGSMGDSYILREELRLLGVKLFDNVQLCKRRLMPLITSKRLKEDENAELDRLYRIFAGVLDLLQEEFIRVITLQSHFPLWAANCLLIQTGVSDNLPYKKLSGSGQGSQDLTTEERLNLEQEEFSNLEKKITSLQELSYTTSQLMDIKPWDVKPDTDHTKIEVETSDIDGPDDHGNAGTEVTTHANTESPRHRKWVWVVVLVVGTLVVLGIVLGLALTLNTDDDDDGN